MAQGGLAAQLPAWRDAMRRAASRSTALLASMGLVLATVLVALALVSYRPSDPAMNTAASGPAQNWLGTPGAYLSEALLLLFGPLAGLLLPLVLLVAARLWRDAPLGRWGRSALVIMAAILLVGSAMTLVAGPSIRGLPLGWGGLLGYAGGAGAGALLGLLGNPETARFVGWGAALLLGGAGLYVWYRGLGLDETERAFLFRRRDEGRVRISAPEPAPKARKPQPRKTVEPPPEAPRAPVIADPKSAAPSQSTRPRQRSLNLDYELPPLELLNPPADTGRQAIDRAGLERNARLLESVLDDFALHRKVLEHRFEQARVAFETGLVERLVCGRRRRMQQVQRRQGVAVAERKRGLSFA